MGLKEVLNTDIKHSSKVLESKRKEALAAFEQTGFPTKNHEEWRFTNVSTIVNTPFKIDSEARVNKSAVEKLDEYKFDANIVVVYNGRIIKELSRVQEKNDKVFIGSFEDAIASGHEKVFDDHFGKYANDKADGFTALNTSMINSGLLVYVPKNALIEKPVMIINYIEESDKDVFANHRNLIVVENGGKADVSEVFYASGKRSSFSNTVTEILLGKNAELHHNKIQNEGAEAYHVGTTQVEQRNHSRFYSTVIYGAEVF